MNMATSGKKLKQIWEKERRFFGAVGFLLFTLAVNWVLYAGQELTTEECAGGKCAGAEVVLPALDARKSYYYVDGLFENETPGYYRLAFGAKAETAEKLRVKLNTYTEKESPVGEVELAPGDAFEDQELFFHYPGGFDSLLFEKETLPGGEVFLENIGISRLNIDSEKELALMKKTVIGRSWEIAVSESQLNSADSYPWLRDKKTALGQIFQASAGSISAVSLNLNIHKNILPGSRQYALSLRQVNYDGESVSLVGPEIASLAFSLESIEKYRQEDGTFLFPLFGFLEPGKYYMISLDNSKVEVDEQNFLELRGSRLVERYPAGTAVIKKGKLFYRIDGDLFFALHSPKIPEGEVVLSGAKIEDLGKGSGKYSYQTKGDFSDLFDLFEASPQTRFDEKTQTIVAPAKDESSFTYEINTLWPIEKVRFLASQAKAGWKKVRVEYSFDRESWNEVPFTEAREDLWGAEADGGSSEAEEVAETGTDDEELLAEMSSDEDASSVEEATGTVQIFDFELVLPKEKRGAKQIFFRIGYDPNDPSKARNFSLKNLRVTAELNMY